jgi:hypothetical protein
MIGLLIFWFLGSLGAGYACLLAGRVLGQNWRLHRQGRSAQGSITGHRKERIYRHRDTNARYFVSYQYVYEGTTYIQEQQVSQRHYEQWERGKSVQVQCLPFQPTVATLVEDRLERRWAPAVWVVTLVATLFFVVGFLSLLAQALSSLW